jgi:hypothetical protein
VNPINPNEEGEKSEEKNTFVLKMAQAKASQHLALTGLCVPSWLDSDAARH